MLQIVNLNTDLIFIKISSDNHNHKAFNHDGKTMTESYTVSEREKEGNEDDKKKSSSPNKLNQNLIRKFLFESFNSVTL